MIESVKLKIIRPTFYRGKAVSPGQEISVNDDRDVANLIGGGKAMTPKDADAYLKENPPAKKAAKKKAAAPKD